MESLNVKSFVDSTSGKWSSITIDSVNYVYKFDRKDEQGELESISCWLSDFNSMWIETIAADVVSERLKKCNPLLACKEMMIRILSTIAKMPQNDDHVQLTVLNDDEVHLSTKYYLSDGSDEIPLKFFWSLVVGSTQSFYEKFSQIMLLKIIDLEKTNDFLMETIRRKDEELDKHAKNVRMSEMSSTVCITQSDERNDNQNNNRSVRFNVENATESDTENGTGNEGVFHEGFTCNNCDGDIFGHRYRCLECEDFDLCMTCERTEQQHAHHIMVRYAQPEDWPRTDQIFRSFNKQATQHRNSKKKRYSKH